MASSKKKAEARRPAPAGVTKAGAGARKAAAPPRRPAPSKAVAQKPATATAADKPIRRNAQAQPPKPAAKPTAGKTVAKPAAAKAAVAKPAPAARPATAEKPKSVAKRLASRATAAVAAVAKSAADVVRTSRSRAATPAAPKPAKLAAPPAKAAAAAEPKASSPRKVRPRVARARKAADAAVLEAPHAVDGLSEEDQIRAAKYLPRELPKRLFEEERFLFPETYGVNRIRLLVRDPEWIFAYWDVSPSTLTDLGRSLGERALALSRLTLRVLDPVGGGSSDILLPPGARWWYIRTDAARRTYKAELGVTLPSGQFRRIAESNTVVTPRVGPSKERARRRMSYPDAREIPVSAAEAASAAESRDGLASEPFAPGSVAGAAQPGEAGTRTGEGTQAGKGGASDTFRPGGASDTFRPGASDSFRR